jgi:hypothetical protein
VIALLTRAWSGTLVGEVLGPGGEPVEDALIVAYDSRFRYTSGLTDLEGRWRIEALPADTYRIRVLPPAGSEVSERWAGDTILACEADRIPVDEGEVSVDVQLHLGARLAGTPIRTDGALGPLVDGEIHVVPSWHREVGVATRVARTGLDGSFSVDGLVEPPEGFEPTWLVEIQDGEVPGQFFQGAWTEDGATPVRATVEEPGELGAFDVFEGVTLTGVVRGPNGPVADGTVSVTSSRRTLAVPIAADGTWTASGLFPGELLVWAVSPGLGRTYWPDADRPAERVLATEGGEVIAGIDLLMPAESRLRGQIIGSGDLTAVNVALVNDDGTVAHSAGLDASGVFVIPALRSGAWTLEVYGSEVGFVEGPLRDAAGERVSFEVPEADELDLGRVDVAAGASISGRAVALGSGEPVYGAAIIAESAGAVPVRRIAFTWIDGTFEIPGLREGSWSLELAYAPFCVQDPGWIGVHWPGVIDGDLAGRVDLSAGERFTWDPVVPPDADLDGMDDLWEVANGLDPSVDDATGDPDGDGFTNRQEYRLGTDPNQVYERGCDCAGTRVVLVLPALALFTRRRRGRSPLQSA